MLAVTAQKRQWGPAKRRAQGPSGLHGLHQRSNAYDFHDPLQVVGEYLQAHFGTDALQSPGQEMGGPHPVLQGAEGMLNCLPSDPHDFGVLVEPLLHGLQAVLMLPASHPPVLAGRAFILDGAPGAI